MSQTKGESAFLSLRSIGRSFGGVRALDDVSLDVHAGEVHCLAGENGSGKSTLIKVIAGVHRPQTGTIRIAGHDLTHLTPMQSVAFGIQVIYQDLSLFPNLTVAENLALNTLLERRRRLVRRREVRETAARAIANLRVSIDLDRLVGELSIAQKQLVAIARALLQDAKLVILDEPTTALTNVEINALFDLVRQLKARGVAMLFVSHKMREMLQISDRFTILRNGTVVESGPAREFDESRVTLAMTGRALGGDRFLAPEASEDEPILRVSGLTGAGLRGVGFELRAGEIVGLTGLLGAGQRELGLTLAGLKTPTAGEIRVRGMRRAIRRQRDARLAGIAYVPADRLVKGLFLEQPVAQNLNASSLRHLRTRAGFTSKLKAREQVSRWMREFSIRIASPRLPARALSGGNQQRVVLAKALTTGPRILILDGPTVGVDIGSKEELHLTMRQLARRGMGVLMISDDLAELAQHCNRVLILSHGAIVGELTDAALTEGSLSARLDARALSA